MELLISRDEGTLLLLLRNVGNELLAVVVVVVRVLVVDTAE